MLKRKIGKNEENLRKSKFYDRIVESEKVKELEEEEKCEGDG